MLSEWEIPRVNLAEWLAMMVEQGEHVGVNDTCACCHEPWPCDESDYQPKEETQ